MSGVTQAAIAAVGAPVKSEDWRLQPLEHARRLPDAAGALKRVLEQPEIAETMARYEAADAAALLAQKQHRTWTSRANTMRFGAVCIGTVALLSMVGLVPGWLSQIFAVLQYALIVAALGVTMWLSRTIPLDRWKNERAKAESFRAELFSRVAAATVPQREGELPLLPLQLEYFRRYQLDVQQGYYSGRARQLVSGAARAERWHNAVTALTILAAVLALVGLVAMLVGGSGLGEAMRLAENPTLRTLLLIFGILASATESWLAADAAINQDQRAAAIFQATAANLDALAQLQLADARAAAAAGSADAVQDFMTVVQLAMSSEHQTWKQLQQTARRLRLDSLQLGSGPQMR